MVAEGGLMVSKCSKNEGDMKEKLDENKVRIYGLTRVLSEQHTQYCVSSSSVRTCSHCCYKVLGAGNPKTYDRCSQVTAHI